jgi:hypothetical protein
MHAGSRTLEGKKDDKLQDGIAHPRHGRGQRHFAQAQFPAPPYALGLIDPALVSQLLAQGYSPRNSKMGVTVVSKLLI